MKVGELHGANPPVTTLGSDCEKYHHAMMATTPYSPFRQTDKHARLYRTGWKNVIARFGDDYSGQEAFVEFMVHSFPPYQLDGTSAPLDIDIYDANATFLSYLEYISPGSTECYQLTPQCQQHLFTTPPPSVSAVQLHLSGRQLWDPDYDSELVLCARDYFTFSEELTQRRVTPKVCQICFATFFNASQTVCQLYPRADRPRVQ
jgi:hypothetical protein